MSQKVTREALIEAIEAIGGAPGGMDSAEYADQIWDKITLSRLTLTGVQDEAAAVVHEALSLIADPQARIRAAGVLPVRARQIVRRAWDAGISRGRENDVSLDGGGD